MSNLENLLQQAFDSFKERKSKRSMEDLQINAETPWQLNVQFKLDGTDFTLRSLTVEDTALLLAFREQLSPESRSLFCPYPWDDREKLRYALTNAVSNSINQIDATYILTSNAIPAGHCFLWKAKNNSLSQEHGVQVPELGIAAADAFHGRGLGGLMMIFLQAIATKLNADGIELTTALHNEPGFRTYKSVGYQYVGDIQNPAEVDVTSVATGEATATEFTIERQMILILNKDKEQPVMQYLAEKRKLFDDLAKKANESKKQ